MRVFDSERESCLQLVQLAVIIQLAVLIVRRKEQIYFPKPSQNLLKICLNFCSKYAGNLLVFGRFLGPLRVKFPQDKS